MLCEATYIVTIVLSNVVFNTTTIIILAMCSPRVKYLSMERDACLPNIEWQKSRQREVSSEDSSFVIVFKQESLYLL